MKKKLTMCLSVALIAVMAICGTLAYLTSEDSDVNTMTLGNVEIEQIEQQKNEAGELEPFEQDKAIYPGTSVSKIVSVKNTGKNDCYVRTLVAFEMIDSETFAFDYSNSDSGEYVKSDAIYEFTAANGTKYKVVEFVREEALESGETTGSSLEVVTLNGSCTNEDMEALGERYDVLVLSQAVQVEGFDNARTALDAGFGAISNEKVAEWFNGMKVRTSVETEDDLEAALKAAEIADVTIDLNEKEFVSEDGFINNGTATIENGTLNNGSSTGYATRTTYGGETIYNDVVIVSSGGGVNVWGKVVFNGTSVTTNSMSTSSRHVFYVAGDETQGAKGELTINGGEFTFSPDNLTRKGSYICAEGPDATVIVNGGTFHKPSTRTAPIQALSGANVTIYGGKFQFDPSAFVADGYQAVEENGWWTVSAN